MKTGELVEELREGRGWNQSELARRVSRRFGKRVPPQSIQQLEAGEVDNPRYLWALAAELGISIENLQAGRRPPSVREDGAQYSVEPGGQEWDIPGFRQGRDVLIPRLDVHPITGLSYFEDGAISVLAVDYRWLTDTVGIDVTYAAITTVRGDRMAPTLVDGDLLLVDLGTTTPSDGVCILDYQDRLLICRLQHMPTGLRVKSDNTHYDDFDVDAKQPGFRILGRVRWIWRGQRI